MLRMTLDEDVMVTMRYFFVDCWREPVRLGAD